MSITTSKIKARISLTTISARIPYVHRVITSLLRQTEPGFRLRLYVSEEPYLQDEGVRELPSPLQRLCDDPRFEIRFVENTGPYRKLLPELLSPDPLASPDAASCPIVTADDDVLYPPRWLEVLLKVHQDNPDAVIAYRARLILADGDGQLLPYRRYPLLGPFGSRFLAHPQAVLPTGKAGILYPPGSLHDSVLDKAFLEVCPMADDLWFKLHSAAAGRRSIAIYHPQVNPRIREIQEVAHSGLYFSNMNSGSAINNDTQLRSGLEYLIRKGVLAEGSLSAPQREPSMLPALFADRAFARLVEWPGALLRKRMMALSKTADD